MIDCQFKERIVTYFVVQTCNDLVPCLDFHELDCDNEGRRYVCLRFNGDCSKALPGGLGAGLPGEGGVCFANSKILVIIQ